VTVLLCKIHAPDALYKVRTQAANYAGGSKTTLAKHKAVLGISRGRRRLCRQSEIHPVYWVIQSAPQ